MSVTCNFKNCEKRATYAFTYGKPDRCIDHKENRKNNIKYVHAEKGHQSTIYQEKQNQYTVKFVRLVKW